MLQFELSASVRNTSGKGAMRQLRIAGMTPAVVYGGGGEATQLQLDTKSLTSKLLEYARKNSVVTLKIDGSGEKNVMVREIQTDPVLDTLVHVDFCEINLEKARTYMVPVKYEGTPKGVDLGGILTIDVNEVLLKGRPMDVPNNCVINIAKLGMGDKITCAEIEVPAGVELLTKGSEVAVSVARPLVKAAAQEDTKKAKKK